MDTSLLFGYPFGYAGPIQGDYRAIGWVSGRLYFVIFEIAEDSEGEYYHLITLWKATKEEERLYEENS